MREASNGEKLTLLEVPGHKIQQTCGSFDGWMITDNGKPLLDKDYFNTLVSLSKTYGSDKVYNDFVSVYDAVQNEHNNQNTINIHEDSLDLIQNIATTYDIADETTAKVTFFELYTTMFAEEMKANTRLGKRIKRLAVHQLLILGKKVEDVACYSRGMTWEPIDAECAQYGF